jgi:hypothetical protein
MRNPVITVLAAATTAVAVSLSLSATATAAPNIENAEDERFMALLDNSGVLGSFNLQKRQGQWFCEAVIRGQDSLDATEVLMENGGYPFDVASAIASAAAVVYCPCADYYGIFGKPLNQPCGQFETAYRNGQIN